MRGGEVICAQRAKHGIVLKFDILNVGIVLNVLKLLFASLLIDTHYVFYKA